MGWATNIFPLLIVTSSGGFTGLFEYSPGPGAGNLIASGTAQAGTDPYGNAYLPGLVTYTKSVPFVAIQLSGLNIQFWTASSQTGPWTANGAVVSYNGAVLSLNSGTAAGAGTAGLTMASGASVAAALNGFQAAVALVNQAAPSNALTVGAAMLYGANGFARYVSTVTGGDGSNYGVGEAVYFVTAAQTINPTAVTDITGLTQSVAAGSYYFKGIFRVTQGAANVAQNIGFSAPAVSYSVWYENQSGQGNTSDSETIVHGALGLIAFTAVAANDETYIKFEGTATFSAAGTFKCQAQAPTAGDNFTIQPGTFFIVRPI